MNRLKSEIAQLEVQINSDRLKISNELRQLRAKIDTILTSPYVICGGFVVGFGIIYWELHKNLMPLVTRVKSHRDKIAQSGFLRLIKKMLANISIGTSLIRLIGPWL